MCGARFDPACANSPYKNDNGCCAPAATARILGGALSNGNLLSVGMVNPRNLTTLTLAAIFCAFALALSVEQLTFFVSDDAYYYLNVARNITHGAGSSFDGINPTNGYHPLWMLCLLPVYRLWGHSPELSLRMTLVTQSLLLAGTVWLAWDLYRRYARNSIAVIIGIAVVGTLFSPMQIMFNGLETDLVVLLVVAIVYADAKWTFLGKEQPKAQQAVFGALLGLLMLARLDEAFLVVGLAIWALIRKQPLPFVARLRSLCRSYWLTVVVFAAVVAPYFVWNYAEFGHLTPISGTLKATFPHPVFRSEVLIAYAPYVALTLLAGMVLIAMLRRPEGALLRPNLDLLTGLWLGCLLQVIWAVFFTSWGTFQWHFAAHIPTTCLILSFYAARLFPNPTPRLVTSVAAAAAIAVVAFNLFAYYDKGDYHGGAYAAAVWARSETPPDTVFALRDAGVFGYFSDRPTINLDGLINSYEYQNEIRKGRLMDFLRERGVQFIADAYAPCTYGERHVWVRSYLPPRPAADVAYGLTVARDAEAYRSEDSIFRPLTRRRPICFVVWPFATVSLELRGGLARQRLQQ
jgi:hypothetical protein